MRLLVAGANGATGRHVVDQALRAGYEVTAFVRRTTGLPSSQTTGLRLVRGDVLADTGRLAGHLVAHDAVISTLGNPLAIRDRRRRKIVGQATQNIAEAMTIAGVTRIATMLSYGAGATRSHSPWPVRALGATLLRVDFADLARADEALTGSKLDWTIAHFGALTDEPAAGATLSTELVRPPRYRIARADVAAALLHLAASGAHLRQRIVLATTTNAAVGDARTVLRRHRWTPGTTRPRRAPGAVDEFP